MVIEDFDTNNQVLSAVPLQFLIHIVNKIQASNNSCSCDKLPVYVGEWSQDSCIGVQSNQTMKAKVKIRIPCTNSCTTLQDILTVSPAGLIKGNITRDASDQNIYTMPVEWTPSSNQYGLHQLCLIPVDSHHRTGSQVCLTFQVDVHPPEFVRLAPTGLVSITQASWTIAVDRDIVRPRRSSGVYIRFFKRSTNKEVYHLDVTANMTTVYQARQITFFTSGYTWEHVNTT